jgi:hypothetical protein
MAQDYAGAGLGVKYLGGIFLSRPAVLLPDVESMVVAFLKTNAAVDAIAGGRVYGELPPQPTFPAISILLVSDNVPIEWRLTGTWVQVDCFGSTRLEARTLARTAHSELVAWTGPVDGGVISDVSTLVGVRHIGEPVDNRPRYQFSVRIHAHP